MTNILASILYTVTYMNSDSKIVSELVDEEELNWIIKHHNVDHYHEIPWVHTKEINAKIQEELAQKKPKIA